MYIQIMLTNHFPLPKEREQAEKVFGGKKKKSEAKKTKTFVPGATPRSHPPPPPPQPTGPSAQEMARIRVRNSHHSPHPSHTLSFTISLSQEAIAGAKSLEEVQQLEAMLKAGQIPGDFDLPNSYGHHTQHGDSQMVVEEEEDEVEA